jgi:protein phosphatase
MTTAEGAIGEDSRAPSLPFALEVASLTDVGTEREHNEDSCAHTHDAVTAALVVVADGVSSSEAGETASKMAVESTLRSFREQPPDLPAAKRLHRAVQQANIDIYDLAIVVPELRGMATTVTAVAVDGGKVAAAHVGDSRLYLVRAGRATQLTKDHTLAADRARMGLISERRAREHPDRSTLTRSVGRELIAAVDRLTTSIAQGDALLVCSDGLYNVLGDDELAGLVGGRSAASACAALVEEANRRGTLDNLTAAVIRMIGPTPPPEQRPTGLGARLKRLIGR